MYVCDPVTRTTAFPQSLNKDCAARVSVRFFFFFRFIFPLFFGFRKDVIRGRVGEAANKRRVLAARRIKERERKKRGGGV